MQNSVSAEFPRWLWRAAWAGFFGVVIGGLLLVLVLAAGVADPPRAGPLAWQAGPLTLESGGAPYKILLPSRPFTLEITATLQGDPTADWGVDLSARYGIALNGYRFLRIPHPDSDFQPFIHVRDGRNKITLYVPANEPVTMRVNDEIAWKGPVPVLASVPAWIWVKSGRLRVENISLYYPK